MSILFINQKFAFTFFPLLLAPLFRPGRLLACSSISGRSYVMDRRSFIKGMLGTVFLPFLPRGLPAEKEQHEVWLQRSTVAGFQYYDGNQIWESLEAGELLGLSREPNNPHDNQAVEVFWHGHKLGYIPRYENGRINELLEHEAPLRVKIAKLDESRNSWKRVEFDIFLLVDEKS